MWEKGVLGDSNPVSLNHTVFYVISQHFGTRGRQEHHQIQVKELKYVNNAVTGQTDYVEWVEGITKTRKFGETRATDSPTSLCCRWKSLPSLPP